MLKDSSAGYYYKNKERLQKRTRERYQDLSKVKNMRIWSLTIEKSFWGKKRKKAQWYGCKQHKIFPEDEKQKPVEYRKKYFKCMASIKNVDWCMPEDEKKKRNS